MSLLSDFKDLRKAEQECINNPLHSKDFACNKYCEGPGVPGYFMPGACQILFVMEHPDEEEVGRTGKQRFPFTGPAGRRFNSALKIAGMDGDERIGYTTLVKCRIKNRRSVARVYNECIDIFFNEEVAYARPTLIVCIGEQVARYLCPEAFEGVIGDYSGLYGKTFLSLDRTYLFLPDLYNGSGSTRKLKDKDSIEFSMEFVDCLQVAKEYLVDKNTHREAAGFKPEDFK